MDQQITDQLDGSLADLIIILKLIQKDSDKFWDNNKDWLLDDGGNKVYL